MPLRSVCLRGRPCFLVEHWLFGISSDRDPVSTLFPSGELRNEGQGELGCLARCWVLRKQPYGADSQRARLARRGYAEGAGFSVRILRTAQ